MTHPDEQELVESYYSGLSSEVDRHVAECAHCGALFRAISETLDAAGDFTVPAKGADYGAQVWTRLAPNLPSPTPGSRFPRWIFIPAAALLAAAIFLAGIFTGQKQAQPVRAAPTAHLTPPPTLSMPVAVTPVIKLHKPTRAVHVTPPAAPPHSDAAQDQKLLALNSQLSANDSSALSSLLQMIQGDTSERTKEHALFVLAQSNSPEARNALLHLASQSGNASLQTKALQMLSIIGPDIARQQLANLYVASSDKTLKHKILNQLTLSGAQAQLVQIYRSDKDDQVKQTVIDALATRQDNTGLSQLARDEKDLARRAEILQRLEKLQIRVK